MKDSKARILLSLTTFSGLLWSLEHEKNQRNFWRKASSIELLSVDSDSQPKTYVIVIAKKLKMMDIVDETTTY